MKAVRWADRARALLAGAALAALACGALAGEVTVRGAWVRAPAPGQKNAAAYLEISSGADAALVAAESPAAERVELHATSAEGGVVRMRPVARIALPAGRSVRLAPGGEHLMLFGLARALTEGGRVPLALTIERADGSRTTVRVEATVRALAAPASHGH